MYAQIIGILFELRDERLFFDCIGNRMGNQSQFSAALFDCRRTN